MLVSRRMVRVRPRSSRPARWRVGAEEGTLPVYTLTGFRVIAPRIFWRSALRASRERASRFEYVELGEA